MESWDHQADMCHKSNSEKLLDRAATSSELSDSSRIELEEHSNMEVLLFSCK